MPYDGELKFDTSIDKTGFKVGIGELGSIAQSGMTVVTAAVGAASAAVASIGGYAVSVGKNFESSMSQVAATMGITKDTVEKDGVKPFEILEQAAAKAGEQTVFSASEAADALNYLALAGYDAQKAAEALPAVLNLASAGGMDLAYASDLATDAMAALGIEATNENLTRFGDELAKTASTANASVSQLGEAILTVGGTAKSLAGGTMELNAALGVLANRGIKGSEGGTALRNIILALTAPTDKAAASMEEFGLSVLDAEGNMRPLNEIFRDLDNALSGMSEGEKTEVLNNIFNKVDLKSAQALLAGCGDEFDNLTTAIDGCDGAMADMAETMTDNLEGDLKSLSSKAEAFGIAVYSGIQAPLREAAQLGGDYITQLKSAFEEGKFDGLAESMGAVISDAIKRIAELMPRFIELGTNVINSLISGIISNKESIVNSAVIVITDLTHTFFTLMPEIISAGIEMITQLAKGIAENAPELASAMADGIQLVIETIADNAPEFIAAAVIIIKSLAQGLINNLDKLINAAFSIVNSLCTELLTADNVAAITSAAGKLVVVLAQAIIDNAGEIVVSVAVGLAEAFSGLSSVFFDFKSETDILADEEEILGENIDDNIDRFRALKEKANNVAAEDLVDLSHVQELYDELKNLADASGNVKSKDVERVEYIKNELSQATGIEIELIDGKIQKYDELCSAIDRVIAQKKAQIFLDASEEGYQEAVLNQKSVEQQLMSQYAAIESTRAMREEIQRKAQALGINDIMAAKDTKGAVMKEKGIDWEEYQKLTELQAEQQENINRNEALYSQYMTAITNYNNAITENAKGNYEAVVDILDNEGRAFQTAKDVANKSAEEQRELLAQQVRDAADYADFILRQYQSGVAGITSEMVMDAKNKIDEARQEYYNAGFSYGNAVADGIDGSRFLVNSAVNDMLSDMEFLYSTNNLINKKSINSYSDAVAQGLVPGFANGGFFSVGEAFVAEAGPELIKIVNGGVEVTPLNQNARNLPIDAFDRLSAGVNDFSFALHSDFGSIINNNRDDHSSGDTTINEENHFNIYTQAKNGNDARDIAENIAFLKSQNDIGRGIK